MVLPGPRTRLLLASSAFQLHIFVWCRERVTGDEPDSRFLDARAKAAEAGVEPDRRDHRLLVDQLLESMQGRLAALGIELRRLLQEEPVDVGIASVHVGTTRGDEGLDPRRGVAEGPAATLDQTLELLLGPSLEERHPLDRPEPHADAGGVEVVDDRFADVGDRSVAEVVAGVEAVGIPSLGQQLPGFDGIVRMARRLPVELEARRDDAPGDLREAE